MAPPVPLPFFCELCKKGYARISELEVHETSYDHHHRKRAADLRSANRDGARRERQAANEGVIKVLGADEHTSKKSSGSNAKRGFKSAFGSSDKTVSTEDLRVKTSKKQDAGRVKTISELYGGSPRARRDADKHDPSSSSALESTALHSTKTDDYFDIESKARIMKTDDKSDVKVKTRLVTDDPPPPPSFPPHKPSMVFKQEPQHEHDDYESTYLQPSSRTDKLEAEITGLSYSSK